MSVHFKISRLISMIVEESKLFDEITEEVNNKFVKTMNKFVGKKVEYEKFKKSHELLLKDSLLDYLQFRVKETQKEVDDLIRIREQLNVALKDLKEGGHVEVERWNQEAES